MSKGIVHTRASLFLAGTLVLVTINHGGGYELALGPVIGVMISPDQDVDNGNVSNTYIRSIPFVGRYLDLAWDALWFFYRKSLKHGSELSHFPVVSTLGRIAYLYLFLIVLPYVALGTVLPGAWNIPHELTWWIDFLTRHKLVIYGMIAADFIHYGLDMMTSENAKTKTKSFNWRAAATLAVQCGALLIWIR